MSSKLNTFINQLYIEQQHVNGHEASAASACKLCCEHTESAVLVLQENIAQAPLFAFLDINTPRIDLQDTEFMHRLAVAVAAVTQSKANISLNGIMGCKGGVLPPEYYALVIPICFDNSRLGSLVALREQAFSDDDLTMGQITAALLATNLHALRNEQASASAKDATAVRAAIGTLSYSELEAAAEVLSNLEGNEGNIIASAIAAKTRVTRSAIVNALRKLESAGLLESHSMGVKGTFIRIKSPALRDGFKRMR